MSPRRARVVLVEALSQRDEERRRPEVEAEAAAELAHQEEARRWDAALRVRGGVGWDGAAVRIDTGLVEVVEAAPDPLVALDEVLAAALIGARGAFARPGLLVSRSEPQSWPFTGPGGVPCVCRRTPFGGYLMTTDCKEK